MTDSPIEKVLGLLKCVKPSGDSGKQWVSCCPAHEDAKASLGIGRLDDGRVLLKCYAGCDTKNIVLALGLEMRDLFPDRRERGPSGQLTIASLAFDKRIPAEFLKSCGLRETIGDGKYRVQIPYFDEAGELLFERSRFALRAKDGTRQPKGVRLQPYGLWKLKEFRPAGRLILVEGESDCWALWLHGYPALGIPGASAVSTLTPKVLTGFTEVYVWREPDSGGEAFERGLQKLLATIPWKVISGRGVKDPCDLYRADPDTFREKFDAIIAAAVVVEAPPVVADPSGTLPYTDYGNAQRLVRDRGSDIRFSGDRWYVWDSRRWRHDTTQQVVRWAKDTIRAIPNELPKDAGNREKQKALQHAVASESGRGIRETVRLAESEPGIAIDASELDADLFMFNCQNGTVDLRTGEFKEHSRDSLLTKISPVTYDKSAKCPTWERFLCRVFAKDPCDPDDPGDTELIGFVRRLFGYCISGDISEQIMPILWGNGSNGKTTLLNTIREVMGKGTGYSAKAPRGLLMARKGESHPTELTVLQGTRLVIATESARHQRLSEDLVKDLTGGEAIQARHMRQDFYEFEPTHKLALCTNHRPRIVDGDDGIWRRIVLVPFLTRFWNPAKKEIGPDHLKRDNRLPNELKQERSGILNWLIRGCLEWQIDGLNAPAQVVKETETYRENEDMTAQFLSTCCRVSNGNGDTSFKEVYSSYCQWMGENNVRPVSGRVLSEDLRNHGIRIDRGTGNRVICYGLQVCDNKAVKTLDDFNDD